jgi:DNA-binding NarL/FixJ family response regulator
MALGAPATNNPRPTFPLSSMTRILIADDHEVVRSGLRLTLQAHEGWEVVAEASDGKEAVAKAVETKPDVAIIDFSLLGMNGIDATRQIRARVPTAEVLIFTMHDSDVLKRQALEAGACAYLLKSGPTRHLISAVGSLGPQRRYANLMSRPQRRPSGATVAVSAYPEHQTRDGPSESEIRATLVAMLATEAFRTSPQLAAFLRFIVEAELRGERASLKSYTIAVEALGRGEDFDPNTDPIVRVEAGRLRRALQRYYDGLGASDLIAIDVPLGRYIPTFRYRKAAQAVLASPLRGKSFIANTKEVSRKSLNAMSRSLFQRFITRWWK